MNIKKILAKLYYYLKKIYNYIHLNIFNINIKNKYNVTKIQKQNLINFILKLVLCEKSRLIFSLQDG